MSFICQEPAPTQIYTLSLHDALPIWSLRPLKPSWSHAGFRGTRGLGCAAPRSEEHTSELQSQSNLVCRLLLEKKKAIICDYTIGYLRCAHLRIDGGHCLDLLIQSLTH